jgi:glucose-1-phosphate adenylyltransferase
MDLVAPLPVFNLYNDKWPVYTLGRTLPPAKLVYDGEFGAGDVTDSILCNGTIVSGASVRSSVLSPGVRVHAGANVEGAILLDDVIVERGAVVHNAIIDKHVIVPAGAQIGVDREHDAARGFTVSTAGVVAVAKGAVVEG